MQKKIIIANWKMNPSSSKEALKLVKETVKDLKNFKKLNLVICPPFVYFSEIKKFARKFKLGSQNVSYLNNGPLTGEIGVGILKDFKIEYVILGHSERRELGETNQDINKKLKNLPLSMNPILCIGEKERDNEFDYLNFVQKQIEESLDGINKKIFENLIIAYEPVWAIGSGALREATPFEFHEMKIFIKKVLSVKFSLKNINNIKIIYGGSVDDKNIGGFLKEGESDGFLVGRASLDSKKFIKIINSVEDFKI